MSDHYEYSGYTREEFYYTKDRLLENWDRFFSGEKGQDYLDRFWRPRQEDIDSDHAVKEPDGESE